VLLLIAIWEILLLVVPENITRVIEVVSADAPSSPDKLTNYSATHLVTVGRKRKF
jgi:hypothetical protein